MFCVVEIAFYADKFTFHADKFTFHADEFSFYADEFSFQADKFASSFLSVRRHQILNYTRERVEGTGSQNVACLLATEFSAVRKRTQKSLFSQLQVSQGFTCS
jgi:hypothetical protein